MAGGSFRAMPMTSATRCLNHRSHSSRDSENSDRARAKSEGFHVGDGLVPGRGVGQVPDLLGDADPPLGLVVAGLARFLGFPHEVPGFGGLAGQLGTTRQIWSMACGPSFFRLGSQSPMRAGQKGAACNALAVV